MYDLIIENGTLVDGTGAPSSRADIAIKQGKIAEIGDRLSGAERVLSADGLVVVPGFIDMHTHYDCQLLWDPLATSSSWHGVTTALIGNCGYSIAPKRPSDTEYYMQFMAAVEGIPVECLHSGPEWTWESFGEYLGSVGGNLGINVAAQVGHSALRYYVMGQESTEREATSDEVQMMKGLLRESMGRGAFGFSTLQSVHQRGAYGQRVPSQLSTLEELMDLCSVLGEFPRGIFSTNPRPGAGVIDQEFQDFLIQVSKRTGRPAVWNQFFHTWANPTLYKDLLRYMDRAAEEEGQVYAVARCQRMDTEFNLGRTAMFNHSPAWKDLLGQPHDVKTRMLSDPAVRGRLREEWETVLFGAGGRRADLLEVGRVKLSKNKGLEGRRLAEMAAEQAIHPVDSLLDLALEEELGTQFVFVGTTNGDPAAVEEITTGPYCLAGASDAGAHLDTDCGVNFTGVLLGEWVREKGVMTLEEAVRRLTSMPASVLGITDRGSLKEGAAADVVLFDPDRIGALPREIVNDLPGGGPRIIQRAEGVKEVVVNGQLVFEDGRHTGALPGEMLGLPRA
jgi:N-acyl-D-aspartate/D-glutamate deacylase